MTDVLINVFVVNGGVLRQALVVSEIDTIPMLRVDNQREIKNIKLRYILCRTIPSKLVAYTQPRTHLHTCIVRDSHTWARSTGTRGVGDNSAECWLRLKIRGSTSFEFE